MRILDKLAEMLGVRSDQIEDALADESRAQTAVKLSRRGFFAAGATMAAAPLVPKRAYSFLFDNAVAGAWSNEWNALVIGSGMSIRIAAHFWLVAQRTAAGEL